MVVSPIVALRYLNSVLASAFRHWRACAVRKNEIPAWADKVWRIGAPPSGCLGADFGEGHERGFTADEVAGCFLTAPTQ